MWHPDILEDGVSTQEFNLKNKYPIILFEEFFFRMDEDQDLQEWLNGNIGTQGDTWDRVFNAEYYYVVYGFKTHSDAALFKLRWQ